MRTNIWAALLLGAVAVHAGDLDPNLVPVTDQVYEVVVPPHKTLSFTVTFIDHQPRPILGTPEKDISVYHAGRRVAQANSHYTETWTKELVNNTDQPCTYVFLGWFKEQFNEKFPWYIATKSPPVGNRFNFSCFLDVETVYYVRGIPAYQRSNQKIALATMTYEIK